MTHHDPADPLTVLAQAAAEQHELFTAWVNAGFTRDEALRLLIEVIRPAIRAAREAVQDDE